MHMYTQGIYPENTPMGDELKWLLKKGGGRIFENPLSIPYAAHNTKRIIMHIHVQIVNSEKKLCSIQGESEKLVDDSDKWRCVSQLWELVSLKLIM